MRRDRLAGVRGLRQALSHNERAAIGAARSADDAFGDRHQPVARSQLECDSSAQTRDGTSQRGRRIRQRERRAKNERQPSCGERPARLLELGGIRVDVERLDRDPSFGRRGIRGDRDINIRTGLLRTRNPGTTLVEEATRIGADVIYLSTRHAPPSEQRIGPTAGYLLDKRPCRIVIETDNPMPARAA